MTKEVMLAVSNEQLHAQLAELKKRRQMPLAPALLLTPEFQRVRVSRPSQGELFFPSRMVFPVV